jgi:hypothetical protein
MSSASGTTMPLAYQTSASSPEWLNKGDNAWQLTAATLVGLQSFPGLVVLYGGVVKKKWAVNSAFMALYAFAAVWICWVTWAYNMSFGDRLLPLWGKARPALSQGGLVGQAGLPATAHHFASGALETPAAEPLYPMATVVYFQCVFAAITLVLVAGSLLGRMSFAAWMLFVPLWLTFSYTVGAFSVWGGGFLFQWGVIDYCGGYVIHLSAGFAGFTAAYWVSRSIDRSSANNACVQRAVFISELNSYMPAGGAPGAEGQGEVPAEQHPVHAHRRGPAVDGVGRLQRRRAVRRQRGGVHVGAQHQHLHRHEPPRLDLPRRRLLQEALRRGRRPGHDHRPRLHHARRRSPCVVSLVSLSKISPTRPRSIGRDFGRGGDTYVRTHAFVYLPPWLRTCAMNVTAWCSLARSLAG